jgi:hypothetical protein
MVAIAARDRADGSTSAASLARTWPPAPRCRERLRVHEDVEPGKLIVVEHCNLLAAVVARVLLERVERLEGGAINGVHLAKQP